MITCSGGFSELRNSAQQALITSIHFAFSRKAWDDKQRSKANLKALDDAIDFLSKVQGVATEFFVFDRFTREQLDLCRKAMIELQWLKPEDIYSKEVANQLGEYHAKVVKAKQQFVYSSDKGLGAIDQDLIEKPTQLFGKIYDQFITEHLSQRQGCF